MVIRESLKSLRYSEPVKTITDIKANRRLLSNINTNISTLRCYNFDIEGTDTGNSTFLIEMEEKVPHIVYTKWEEEKTKLEAEGEEIDIAKFIMFYTNLVNIEENAQYLRKTTHSNDKGGHSKNKALVLHGDVKSNVPQVKSFNYTPKKGGKATYAKKGVPDGRYAPKADKFASSGQNYGQFKSTQFPAGEGTPFSKYCVFCEVSTHNTSHCNVFKYTEEYKQDKCKKHNACFMCFRTSEHQAQTCPNQRKCFICPRKHHFNMHARKDIVDYYKNQNTKIVND